jgi:site-specific recombinase XerD
MLVVVNSNPHPPHRLRDATLILVSYRHGLRVTEATSLRWEQVDFRHQVLEACVHE